MAINLARQIRRAVNEGQVTVAELSRLTGISRAHIYRIMDGKHDPGLGHAMQLARAIGKTIEISES